MRPPLVLLLLGATGAIAFFAGRETAPTEGRASADRSLAHRADPAATARVEQLQRQLDEARETLDRTEARIEELERDARAAPSADAGAPEAAKAGSSAPRFEFPGQQGVLQQVDWQVVGEATLNLQPLVGKLATALRDGEDVEKMTEEIGSIQRWNGPLVTQAMKMKNSGLSGTYTNGAFTHPAIIVNQVYATLREAGKPLTKEQEELLGELGTRYIELEARRVAGYDDATLGLKQTLDEAKLKEELYAAIDAMLTETQREALHPAEVRGVLQADLFSSGLVWSQVARHFAFTSRESLTTQLVPAMIRGERIAPEEAETVRTVVTEWVAGLPDAFLQRPLTPEVEHGFLRVPDVMAAAEQCLTLRARLVSALSDDASRANVRAGAGVIVPYRKSD